MQIIDNFAETYHQHSIQKKGVIYAGAGDGKLAFVAAKDIAAVAFRAFTDKVPHNTDHIITGPEALSYDEVRCSALYYYSSNFEIGRSYIVKDSRT